MSARAGAPYDDVALHTAFWIAATSAVGLLLALLLSAPRLGEALGELTYGRLAAIHLDAGLYGATAVPLVGLLLRAYDPATPRWRRSAGWLVQGWTGALLAGAVAWGAGVSSGKVFLDWRGISLALFLVELLALAALLAAGARSRGRVLLWVALLAVPVAMWVATRRSTYPPVNPESGGPTGADLLGSTLGIVAVFLAAPYLLGLARREDRRFASISAAALAAHLVLFLALGRGDHGNAEATQIAAVVSLVPWGIWLPLWLARFAWPETVRRWRLALYAWGALLLASGAGAFLPGALSRVKFTNVLVGHAHVAMAGVAIAFGAIVVETLSRGTFSSRGSFAAWHAGLAAQVAALGAAGWREIAAPGALFRPDAIVDAAYALRVAGGASMVVASWGWLRAAWRGERCEGA